MSAARDVEVEDTATDTDLVLGPETPAPGFSAWRLATIGMLAVVGALCVTLTVSQGIPGLVPAVRRQPGALASLQSAEELPQTGCAEGVVTTGELNVGDNSQCVAACQNQDGCEFVVFKTAPSTATTTAPAAPAPPIPVVPTAGQTASPTAAPTTAPTASPTAAPTAAPTASPTATPTTAPTASPTVAPTPCVDTSGAATNINGFSCSLYRAQKSTCAAYLLDDSDFTAIEMCCVCKGGGEDTLPPPPPPPPPVPNCVLGRGACNPKSTPNAMLTFLHKVPTVAAKELPTATMSPTHTATNLASSQTTVVSCGKGCSNWGDILLDKGSLELEDCKARCDALSGCAAYNYQFDDCEGAPGAKTCYLFSSGCQVAESGCWTLFEKQG